MLLFNIVLVILANVIRQEKGIGSMKIRKKVKLLLFSENMINAWKHERIKLNMLQEIQESGRAKINTQKSIWNLKWDHKLIYHSIKKKKIKYLRINLTRNVQELHEKNFTLKVVNKNSNKWEGLACFGIKKPLHKDVNSACVHL